MKNLIIFIILALSFFSCDKDFNKNQDNNFYIIGNLEDVSDNTRIYLKVQKSNKIITIDTTQVINNSFKFKGKIDQPEVFGIYIDSLKGFIGLFIENDSVFIDIDKNSLSNSKINGSDLNNEYLKFTSESNQIFSKTNYLFPLFQKARTENDVDKLNEINKKIEKINQENLMFVLNYARENPDSYIAAYALQTILNDKSISTDTIASIYNNFSHKVKKGDFAIEILLYLESQELLEKIDN